MLPPRKSPTAYTPSATLPSTVARASPPGLKSADVHAPRGVVRRQVEDPTGLHPATIFDDRDIGRLVGLEGGVDLRAVGVLGDDADLHVDVGIQRLERRLVGLQRLLVVALRIRPDAELTRQVGGRCRRDRAARLGAGSGRGRRWSRHRGAFGCRAASRAACPQDAAPARPHPRPPGATCCCACGSSPLRRRSAAPIPLPSRRPTWATDLLIAGIRAPAPPVDVPRIVGTPPPGR